MSSPLPYPPSTIPPSEYYTPKPAATVPADPAVHTSGLALTGTNVEPLILIAALLVAAGVAVLLIARARRRHAR